VKNKLSTILFFLVLACILFAFTSRFDNDGWFILNSGRYVENYGIPHTEPFTIHENFHFVMQQWLFDVMLWKIYTVAHSTGMLAFSCIFGGIIFFIYYRLLQITDNKNIKVSRFLTIGAGILMAPFFCQRPQTISSLIFLIEIYTLERCKDKNKPPIYIYILFFTLSLILINAHAAMWPMFSVFLLPYLVESLLVNRISWFNHTFRWHWTYVLALFIPIIAAGLINPYGIEAMTYAFNSYGYADINAVVTEMHPLTINFHSFTSIVIPVIILLTIIYAKNPLPIRYILLFSGTGFMALMAIRSIFLFLIAGIFPLASILQKHKVKSNLPARTWKRTWPPMVLIGIATGIAVIGIFTKNPISSNKAVPVFIIVVLLILVSLACAFLLWKQRSDPISLKSNSRNLFASFVILLLFPLSFIYYDAPMVEPALKKSVDIIQEDSAGKPIELWTGYNDGPYAEFRGIPCYLDTRAEVFVPKLNHQKDVFREFVSLLYGYLDYRDFLASYHFTHLLTSDLDPLYTYLLKDPNYTLLYDSVNDNTLDKRDAANNKERHYRVYKYNQG
jgi:hypothetical protein